jgi:hypothetical protein
VLAGQPLAWGDVNLSNAGTNPAVIDGIRTIDKTPGLEVVDVRAATRRTLTRPGFVSIATDNPKWLSLTSPAEGFTVASGGANADEVEIVLILNPSKPGTNYAIHNVAVDYHVGDQHYTTLTNNAVNLCAVTSQPLKVDCPEPPMPAR